MDPLTPQPSTYRVSGNMPRVAVIGLLPPEPFFAFLPFSISQGSCAQQAAVFSGWLPCLVASGWVQLMEDKGWRLDGEASLLLSLCFWEHHCQVCPPRTHTGCSPACQNQHNPCVPCSLLLSFWHSSRTCFLLLLTTKLLNRSPFVYHITFVTHFLYSISYIIHSWCLHTTQQFCFSS